MMNKFARFGLSAWIVIAISGCDNQRLNTSTPAPLNAIEQHLKQARSLATPAAEKHLLEAAKLLQQDGKLDQAEGILSNVNIASLPKDLQADFIIVQTQIALEKGELSTARKRLTDNTQQLPRIYGSLSPAKKLEIDLLKAQIYELDGANIIAAQERIYLSPNIPEDQRQHNNDAIWRNLIAVPTETLAGLARDASHHEARGWIELAWIYKAFASDPTNQAQRLRDWHRRNAEHPANSAMPSSMAALPSDAYATPNHIAILLPTQGKLAPAADAIRKGFLAAHYSAIRDFTSTSEPLTLSFYDSSSLGIFQSNYSKAIESGAQLIIGPLQKDNVRYLQQLPQIPVPTIALNYGDHYNQGHSANLRRNSVPDQANTSNVYSPSFLYQFGLAAEDEARTAAQQAWNLGYNNAGILYPDNEWGKRVNEAFTQRWTEISGNVLGSAAYSKKNSLAKAIQQLLLIGESKRRGYEVGRVIGSKPEYTPRRRQDLDFVFVFASPKDGRQINPLFSFYYARELPLLATSHIDDGVNKPALDRDLERIQFTNTPWAFGAEPSLKSKLDEAWPKHHPRYSSFFAFGIDAFRLYTQIQQLANTPGSTVAGATGTLSLDHQNRIVRTLPWGVFSEGEIQPLEPLPSREIPSLEVLPAEPQLNEISNNDTDAADVTTPTNNTYQSGGATPLR